ncbi:MAG: nucleoside hydrolase [Acidibrevibacterium sp.]|uniref:nucleoside hydrolase n=1 Tax=Acidibrevibacterium fodinaquatile TaxID=1969806 RepID=UPI0023A7B172|nr:nucleoside hydrolase [Acidibrevibacterium fodinaquatile]MCA7120965.1 nucleoside hydrolase [Acidibrevibacterium fodinaquatile]
MKRRSESAPALARPIIIDCDPGTDDAIALWLALASPEIALQAITVVGGNVGIERTLANALALVALAGAEVPVHAGAGQPIRGEFTSAPRAHGENGLAGIVLPPGGAPAPGVAADVIRAHLRAATAPLTLVGIGPATNLARALMAEPDLAAKIGEIVLMSGAFAGGNITPAAEFNAWSDPEALSVLLAAGRPLTLAPLDLTHQALVTPSRLAHLRAAGAGTALAAACDILAALPPHPTLPGRPLHDPCAIAWLLRPDLFTARPARVAVSCAEGATRGQTTIAPAPEETANALVLETLDAEGFFALLGERLSRLP